MSLDVSLLSVKSKKVTCYSCGQDYYEQEPLYSSNITHNLGTMAEKAGIYKALWRPEEINCKYAIDIIGILEVGLEDLEDNPDLFKKYNSPNGWGMYKHFVPFVKEYLNACKKYPDAEIHISR